MSWEPWCQAEPPLSFMNCEHCGEPQELINRNVVVCSCKGAQDAELAERERRATFAREQAARQKGRKAKIP